MRQENKLSLIFKNFQFKLCSARLSASGLRFKMGFEVHIGGIESKVCYFVTIIHC